MKTRSDSHIWLKLIAISSVVVAIVIIASVAFMCWKHYPRLYNHDKDNDIYLTKYLENFNTKLDTLSIDSLGQIKLLETLVNEQLIISKRQDDLVNDIRQETNNNIDKINLWLSFWIGLIGLIGILAPVLAEYRFKNSNKDEIDRISKLHDNYVFKLSLLDVQSIIYALSVSHDERIVPGMSNRNSLMRYMLKDAVIAISQLVDYMSKEDFIPSLETKKECKSLLIRSFICLYACLHKLKILNYDICARNTDNVMDEIKDLLNKIEANYMSDCKNINEEIKTVMKDISEKVISNSEHKINRKAKMMSKIF